MHLKGYESGVYGNPPRVKYWARQAVIYVVALTTMKFIVIGLLALFPGLFKIGAWLLSWTWTDGGDAVQVIFVMGIFPIMTNILQFWLIDSIVKASQSSLALPADTEPDADVHEPLFSASSDDDDDDDSHGRRPHLDIENRRPRSRSPGSHSRSHSHSRDKLSTFSDNPYESKSSGSSSRVEAASEAHSYPPSLSGSVASVSSVSISSMREVGKLGNKKRRAPPAPLNLPKPVVHSVVLSPSTPQKEPVANPTAIKTIQRSNTLNKWDNSWSDE